MNTPSTPDSAEQHEPRPHNELGDRPDAETARAQAAIDAAEMVPDGDPHPTIASVNERTPSPRRGPARAIILVLGSALLLGMLVWFAQNWATRMKDSLKSSAQTAKASTVTGPVRNMLNPEGGANREGKRLKLGADASPTPPPPTSPAPAGGDSLRPLRGADGQVLLTRDGKALGVDPRGQVVEVPPILPLDGEHGGKVPLADERPAQGGTTAGRRRPPSRYGGALVADGSPGQAMVNRAMGTTTAFSQAHPSNAQSPTQGTTQATTQATTELLKTLLAAKQGGGAGGQRPPMVTSPNGVAPADGEAERAAGRATGPVGSQLGSSATPVARARRMVDQGLLLPKGRQVDCVLTTRIINELAGMTSCALTQNLYSANGRVLLLERGSEVTGEYGVATQLGLRRLFVVWTRVRTPQGVEVDLQSPGADALGTSGVPGHLEQRWMERIGAALLLSVMRDVIEIEMAKQQSRSGSDTIVLGPQPGENTINAGQDIGEQVVKQTINVKPTLHINEGTRISIYVARDLDFSPVYDLRTVATAAPAPAPDSTP